MSRVFVESLYPAATSLAKVLARGAYESAFPSWAAEKCGAGATGAVRAPLPTVDVAGVVTIRAPALLLPGTIGIVAGFAAGVWCLTRAKPSVRGDFSWGFALMWFGTMNVVALPLHCWVDSNAPLRDELYAATISFTTCACLSAIFAFLANCAHIDDGEQDTHGTLLSVCLFVLIVTSSLTQRAGEAGKDSTPQMILELYYFFVILLLAPFMIYAWLKRSGGGGAGGGVWMAIAVASFAAMASSPLLDAPLCGALGASLAPHAAVVAWLAADVMAASLWMYHRSGRLAAAAAEAAERAVKAAAEAAAEAAVDGAKQIDGVKDEASKKAD